MTRLITATDINKYIRSLKKQEPKLSEKAQLKRLNEMFDNLDFSDMSRGARYVLCYEISLLEGKDN